VRLGLKQRRKELGLTQAEVAEKLGLKRQTYQNYESGKREPGIDTMKSISLIFGKSMEELFF
jgi:DNA-binding XRE family transcriptional regulator